MVSAGVCFDGKGRLHIVLNKTKVNAKLYVETCCRNLFKIADLFCHLASSFNWSGRLHTRLSWLKTGLLPTAVNSLVKMNGLRTRLTLTPLDYHICGAMFEPSWKIPMSSRKWYGTSCHNTQSTKPYWACRKDLGLCESGWWILWSYAKMNLWDFGISNNSQCFMTMKITSCCWLFRAELKIWHKIFIQP